MIIAGTGHRPEKLGGYSDEVLNKLIHIASENIKLYGVTKVISGVALGWDTAIAIAAIKENVYLECAIPFKGQESRWFDKSKLLYNYILENSNLNTYVSDEGYANWKMQTRNEYMVDNCEVILAMWDGSKGGTYNCVKYGQSQNKRIINLYNQL